MTIEKGQTFESKEEIDKYRAIYYAGASGDFNPIHIDNDFGKLVGLGGAILQGLCTLAFAANKVTDWAGDPGKLKKIKCRFSAPVKLESTLDIKGEVSQVENNEAGINLSVTNQDSQEVLKNVEAFVEI